LAWPPVGTIEETIRQFEESGFTLYKSSKTNYLMVMLFKDDGAEDFFKQSDSSSSALLFRVVLVMSNIKPENQWYGAL